MSAADLSPAVVRDETSTSGVTVSGLNAEQSATLKLRLDVEHYNRTGDARYYDESGREIRFLAASDPWDRDSASPVSVPEDAVKHVALETLTDEIRSRYAAVCRAEVDARREVSRLQSALDALAVAVKPVQERVADADEVALCSRYNPERARAYLLNRATMDDLLSAITSLLDGRTTT